MPSPDPRPASTGAWRAIPRPRPAAPRALGRAARAARLAILALPAWLPVPASATGSVEQAIAAAKAMCEDLGGTFSALPDAVSEIDLGGGEGENGRATALDYSKLRCEGAWTAFCGSGGCPLRVQVGSQAWEWQVEGWAMAEPFGFRVLMLVRDGGWCGGAGSQICFETLKWDGQRFLTVGPTPDPAE